jgi:hypothetical protein
MPPGSAGAGTNAALLLLLLLAALLLLIDILVAPSCRHTAPSRRCCGEPTVGCDMVLHDPLFCAKPRGYGRPVVL